ncbi:hypothetical protein GCM10022255_011360 [Dactylosporangium darangshiense]|uniref:Uncharacterized protein n=1 Tax=Dactylosporangium darangshiense TaxID=579108 RepID=A0ABP8CZ22_9ACTN
MKVAGSGDAIAANGGVAISGIVNVAAPPLLWQAVADRERILGAEHPETTAGVRALQAWKAAT